MVQSWQSLKTELFISNCYDTCFLQMRIIDIIPGTSVDGPGLRTAIYFAGCAHQCHGCHNPQSWDFDAGSEMSVEEIMKVIIENDFDVTLTGGDPVYQADRLLPLLVEIKRIGKTVWLYTGFNFSELQKSPVISQLLPYIEVVVDGPFMESQRDIHLLFRGSSNQRLIDVNKSLGSSKIVEWGI